ncbi:3D-(3,5/4)-trihydroxycyclohexane-1,2-dione hydrolase [Rhodobacteraceae bacterium THAF1]|uniref:3D-(3,5/4)-trihydroxycyclohexane-1,2-dione acylhydrolase (decyclizing) n=1 Tax=Palleronia sp. THAF1 TaxID=2587842 RepID=UPI000F40FB99|nr:3D-(3,5/4)-trihydroxycyclohexane-1,2-dione acylhydrolase (decyclizing) [Palleronia sp. THAF1]QFU07553.1 3D-(3,5/4)-trihydroxycyclohexane-1,2-dione hydrolase [Palleronia sp. THAF1]VDC22894.1 3D-(3,5/4)-trihydroxycyclohexane-1,2-dione hydrolase [Rhodobacteraceae bacterium THAF1]
MSETIRLTAAQAMVRWLSVQSNAEGERFVDGVWAIFGHGNVAGLGEALHAIGDDLPTWRGQNEQTMAHAAIAFAKTSKRKRAMAVTSSIGPGATNMVTAAALAHVNRLPILLIPGDVFANRGPDPVLQQIEDFEDGTTSVNDCFRPVSRYFDRIERPEQLLTALPRAMQVMTDAAACGPVTLSFCQDVQAEAYDYPKDFFEPRFWPKRRPRADLSELHDAADLIRKARRPVIVAGGGVIYSEAEDALSDFATRHGIPVVETQAGKSALAWDHPMNLGGVGVTGTDAANAVAADADLVIGVDTRFQDFTTGSWTLFQAEGRKLLSINVAAYDAQKRGATPVQGDALESLNAISDLLGDHSAQVAADDLKNNWIETSDAVMAAPNGDGLPTDAQVIGAVQRQAGPDTVVMCAAGTMPGALHTLWRPAQGGYHMEYGFSCMGYEIAGAMGIKLARPEADVVCFIGDGSYMMANSELATAVMRRIPFTTVITDNRGYACINRLQKGTGGAPFNNMYENARVETQPQIDFVAHAAAMGAHAEKAVSIAELEQKLQDARNRDIPSVIVLDTDPHTGTGAGGSWWDVAVPEVSTREEVREARATYEQNRDRQRKV